MQHRDGAARARQVEVGRALNVLRRHLLVGAPQLIHDGHVAGEGDEAVEALRGALRRGQPGEEAVLQVGPDGVQAGLVHRLRLHLGDGAPDLVLDSRHIRRVLHHAEDAPQSRITAVAEVRAQELHALLVQHQLLVEGRGLAEGQWLDEGGGCHDDIVALEPVALEVHRQNGKRAALERHLQAALFGLLRLGGNLRGLVARLPVTVVLLDQLQRLVPVEIAHHHDHHVLRPVEAVEERLGVLELFRHLLDIFLEADGGVLVGVLVERDIGSRLEQREEWARPVLAELTVDSARLGLEVPLAVLEVLEAIALDVDDLGKIDVGDVEVVAGQVIAGERVGIGPHGGDDVVIHRAGVLLAAPEHHVLEEVSEAGDPVLHLVAAAGAHDGPVGHHALGRHGDQQHLELVVQNRAMDFVGKNFGNGRAGN